MPTVRVRVYAGLRIRLGWKERVIELDENCRSINCLLIYLPEVKNELERYMVKGYDPIILVNGRNIFLCRKLDEELSDGDEVDIFPPSAGGQAFLPSHE